MTIEDTEKAAAEHATAPRVSLKDIEAEISSIAYMTGAKFLSHADVLHSPTKSHPVLQASTLTICMVTLKNGWMVTASGAPASPENYDAKQGQKIAYDKCVAQIWPLMGYQLKEQLHNAA
jgi:Phage protein (N4 Gp49/phage Sf6 gene 66) family